MSDLVGKSILHYRILEHVGQGGMGVVYKARDTELNREVAIKFLPRQIATHDEERRRFKVEAQAAAALNHPHIATIHAIEKTDDETFIVMEYIEGQELKDRIDTGPLSIEDTLTISSQIAKGLQAAHEKGVVHRDIKSTNIMLTAKGDVKVMDFGLAKVRGQNKLTQAGTTLGTVAYMSPEQTRGEDVDQRSDIFSLGVLIYEMLTGQLPFTGDYDQAVTYSILNEDPQPVTGLRTGVPPELERIVNKCLKKDASSRYQHADELIADLSELRKESETKKILSSAEITPDRPKSQRPFLLAAIVGIVIIATVLGYWFFSSEPEPAERVPIAVVDFVNETNEPELNGLSGMLITALEQSRRLDVMSRARMFDELKKMGRGDITFVDEATGREIAKHAKVSALAVATIRKLGETYTIDLKVIEPKGGDHLFTAREEGKGQDSILGMIDRLSEKTRIDLREEDKSVKLASRGVADVTTTNLEAYQHFFLGEQLTNRLQFKAAQEQYRKAIALDSTFALAWYRLAYSIQWHVGSSSLARAPMDKAVALSDRLPEKEKFLLQALKARIEGGQPATLAVLRDMQRIYPNEKEMLYEIGDYAFHANQYSMAIQPLNKVLAMDPTHERALMHLIMTYSAIGEYDKAQPLLERLATVNQLEAYQQAGETQLGQGKYTMALDFFQKAYEIDSTDQQTLFNFVRAYNRLGQYQQAVKYGNEMVSVLGSPLAYICLYWSYAWSGDLDRALQACQLGVEKFPGDHVLRAGIGRIYALQKKYSQAEAHFKAMTKASLERVRREGFLQLAQFYPFQGKYSEMLRMYDKTIEFAWSDNDSNSVARLTAEKAYWMFWGLRNKQDALAEIANVATFRKVHDDSYYTWLVHLYAAMGNLERASEAYKKVLNPVRKMESEASIHAGKQEWRKAIDKWEELVKLRQEYIPLARFLVARYHFELGRYDRAITEISEAQRFFDPDFRSFSYPLGFNLLGKIYEKKGDIQLAIRNYEKFLDIWKDADESLPDLIEAKTRLAGLRGKGQ